MHQSRISIFVSPGGAVHKGSKYFKRHDGIVLFSCKLTDSITGTTWKRVTVYRPEEQ